MNIKKITESRIFLPLVILGIIIAFNVIFNKNFFNITIKDGHFFGSLIFLNLNLHEVERQAENMCPSLLYALMKMVYLF